MQTFQTYRSVYAFHAPEKCRTLRTNSLDIPIRSPILRASENLALLFFTSTHTQEVKIMGRARRNSNIIETATTRVNGIKAFAPTLDLGPGLTLAAFEQAITNARAKLDDYNQTLATLDEKANQVIAAEKSVSELSARMLAGIGARFGKDSNEYEQAGGVRSRERRRTSRKAGTPPTT